MFFIFHMFVYRFSAMGAKVLYDKKLINVVVEITILYERGKAVDVEKYRIV